LLSGLIPTLPLMLVRPFLPESAIWQEKKSQGTLKRPSIAELFRPALRRTTLVTTVLVACTYALPYGATQHTVRMVPGLPDVRRLAPRQVEQTVSAVTLFNELGGLAGRLIFAILITRVVTQRRLMRTFMGAALVVYPWFYFFGAKHSVPLGKLGIFFCRSAL
jgi:predicted secreted protein